MLCGAQVVQVVEATFCSCAAFADPETLVTGSLDHTVCLWHVNRGSNSGIGAPWQRESALSITLTHIMRAHTSEVICVTASRTWSLAVTGSKDGSAALWDLNRGAYVKSIWHGPGDNSEVHLVTVNESIVSRSRQYTCMDNLILFSAGLHRNMFEKQAMSAYCQCAADRLSGSRVFYCAAFVSTNYLYGVSRTRIFACRRACDWRTRRHDHIENMEH